MIDTPNHGEKHIVEMRDEKIVLNASIPSSTMARIRTTALGNAIETFSISSVVTCLIEHAFATMSESEIKALLRETYARRRRPR